MAESWNRYPVGVLEGNTYQMGIYDECVNVQYPVRGQYCLSEIKLNAPAGKDYSFNRTEKVDYFGKNNGWHTILGVSFKCIINFKYSQYNNLNKTRSRTVIYLYAKAQIIRSKF